VSGKDKSRPWLFEWRDEVTSAPELIASDRWVAVAISLRMNVDGEDAFPSIETIRKLTGYSKETVLNSLAWLRESGWLRWERPSRRKSNLYAPTRPGVRLSRTNRTQFMKQRKMLLAASRSERKTNSHETYSVGRNRAAETVGTVAHDLPPDLFQYPSGSDADACEHDEVARIIAEALEQ
jgi:hypothetical protein